MITDDDHPAMAEAHRDLLRKLGTVIGIHPKPLTQSMLSKMIDVVKDHRIYWRMKGVGFPVLVAVVVPRFGVVEWKRADLDLPSIRTSIVNSVRMNPGVTMVEWVNAYRAAYPDLRPDDVLEKHDVAVKATERADEKREQIITEAEKIVKEEGNGD